MSVINWLLISIGNAAQWLWHALATGCGTLWDVVDAVLNPVLFRVLAVLNPICTAIGDGVYTVLAPLPVWLGLTLISAVMGVLMLIGFRYTSNQAAIGRARDDITANLLALKLYKDEVRVAVRAQGRVLGALLRLQWHMLRPLLIMLLPMLLVLAQMGVRHQWRPLRVGERTNITVRLKDAPVDLAAVALADGSALVVEAGPIPGGGALVWRVRAATAGRHTLRLTIGGQSYDKEFVVGDAFQRVSAARSGPRWTAQIFHPVEPLLPAEAPLKEIEIAYPGVASYVYGANWWILYFFIISMLFALLFKPVFKVRF